MDPGASISPAMPLPPGTTPRMRSVCRSVAFLSERAPAHLLLSWLPHVLVCFEQRSNVERLSAPDVSVDGPIKSKLEATTV